MLLCLNTNVVFPFTSYTTTFLVQHLQDEIEKRKQRQAELEERERQLKDVRAKQAELQDKQKVCRYTVVYNLTSLKIWSAF